ncbi:DUF1540 domain-containing protein [Pueribacillus theae]|uniref:DUF1540 domain-containing protein n=1 Tax=Pueribacillus theae TaxID=2171751 RepID=A0A2U1JXV9_9BACI|nr:DUF1540 domain-containing protein [Pueribacillus theae]PWA10051.1 DUF1540 domain-containing protein [Pueribacillus theae]
MAKDVLCEVDTCTFWGDGNKCNADQIYVVKQVKNPETTEETDCKTFEPVH